MNKTTVSLIIALAVLLVGFSRADGPQQKHKSPEKQFNGVTLSNDSSMEFQSEFLPNRLMKEQGRKIELSLEALPGGKILINVNVYGHNPISVIAESLDVGKVQVDNVANENLKVRYICKKMYLTFSEKKKK